jgi:hypothetical protein
MAIEGRIDNTEQGYAITLPDGWMRLDLNEDMLALLAEELGDDEDVELLVDLLQGQLAGLEGMGNVLFAFDLETIATGFATNVSVFTAPSFGMSLTALETINVAQLRQLPGLAGEIHSEHLTLPAGDALYFNYGFEAPAGDEQGFVSDIHQYILIADNTQYLITVSGVAGDEQLAANAAALAESFEFLAD